MDRSKIYRILVVLGATFFLYLVGAQTLRAAQNRAGGNGAAASDLDRARALVIENRRADAIILYRRALTARPTEKIGRIEFARLLASEASTRGEAEKIYQEAIALAPDDHTIALERADNLVALGDSVNAVLEYRRAFEVAPDNLRALKGYVRHVTRLGAAPVAIKQFVKALGQSPGDYKSRLLLASLLQADGRYADAIEQFNLSLSAAPDPRFALRSMAEAWLALGYPLRAEQVIPRLAKEEAAFDAGQSLAWRARLLLASDRPEAAVDLLFARQGGGDQDSFALGVVADAFYALGQANEERALLQALLASPPADDAISILERMARAQFNLQDKTAAREACEQLLARDPGNAVAALGLKLLGVAPVTEMTVQLKTNTPARQAGQETEAGEAALFWNQPSLAVPALKRALNLRGDSPRLYLALGNALLLTKNPGEAARIFAQMNVLDGQRPDALSRWAEAELQKNNPHKALEIYRDALRLAPGSFRLLLGQAEAWGRLGDQERAALTLNDLARLAPESALVKNRLQASLKSLGHPYRAEGGRIEPLIQNGDTVQIKVPGDSARPGQTAEVIVSQEGRVRLPFLAGEIQARCLSAGELGRAVASQAGRQAGGAPVEVSFTKLQRTPLVVAGAVYLPDGFYVRASLDIRQSLMLASGANARAGRSVFVVRDALDKIADCDAGRTTRSSNRPFEMYSRAAVEAGKINLAERLQPGDAVFVPAQDEAFITGAVTRTGVVAARGGITLRRALGMLGGVLDEAQRERVRLLRLLPDGASHQPFIIDLEEIEKLRLGDVVLQPGDIIEIPFRDNREDESRTFRALLSNIVLKTQSSTLRKAAPQAIVISKPPRSGKEKP